MFLRVWLLAQTSQARTVEGFEAGDPAVGVVGDSGSVGTYQSEAPPQGTFQYLITTIKTGDDAGISNQSGTNAVSNATLNNSSNFGGAAPIGTEGSGVFIPISILADDITLTLQFDFLSNEPVQASPRNDFAFYALYDSLGAQVGSTVTFVSVTSPGAPGFSNFGAGNPFIAHTGFQTLSFSVVGLAPGNYTLGLGIEDATNVLHASGLIIDNVQAVPEPSTIGLGLAGAVLLVALRRGFKKA